ncbi:RNA ligase family protein [Conchiformibius steedae DSM 2580]|uniref:RNA ligase family protein n=1 Tax=Conchiformibius steedae DSM 2580 TaxID=1121352 RepID=A0AAE9HW71_9NEIS|nr:RNA ligase family protein [Conchiformibius steedae]URD67502.1 RNA ligase family protein [Conchiformibius steedae DSM 2580]
MSAAKYPRSLHAPISLGTTSDDRFMPAGYLRHFAQLPQLLITEKLDGQNNCFNRHGLFARSHAAPSQHPWDKPLLARWQQIRHDLGDIELFGESLYGIHSIAYSRLESFFYLFGVRQNGRWLDWDEVKFYAALFDFPTVPEIPVPVLPTIIRRWRIGCKGIWAWLGRITRKRQAHWAVTTPKAVCPAAKAW